MKKLGENVFQFPLVLCSIGMMENLKIVAGALVCVFLSFLIVPVIWFLKAISDQYG
jgi:hypothetical protein